MSESIDAPFDLRIGGKVYKNCTWQVSQYAVDGSMALRAFVDDEYGPEPLTTASVYIDSADTMPGCIFVKDYSENEGMLEELVRLGVGVATGRTVQTGWVEVPELKLIGDWAKIIEKIDAARKETHA